MSTTSDYFIELASLDPQIRISAAQSIITILKKAESEIKNGEHSEVMVYSLNRLIKSLGSSHDCARDGNLLCLILLLQTFPSIQESSVVDIATSTFTTTGNARQALRDVLFGRLCTCLALIKAQRVNETETVEYIMKTLFFLANKKSYLCEVTTEALILLIKNSKGNIKSLIIASINEHMKQVTKESILPIDVSLVCLQSALEIKITIPSCFEKGLFSEDGISAIHLALKTACETSGTSQVPLLHYLIQYSRKEKQFKKLMEEVLLPMSKGERICYSIFMALSQCFKDFNQEDINIVLQPKFVKLLLAISLVRRHPLKKVVAHLLTVIGQSTNYAFDIIKNLIGDGGSIYFDQIAGVKTISRLSKLLEPEESDKFIQLIITLFDKKANITWLLEMIVYIALAPNINKETHDKILTLLYAIAHKYPHEYLHKLIKNESATQRYLQLSMTTHNKDYIAEMLSNFTVLYEFKKQQEDNKIPKDFEKAIKKNEKKPVFQLLLYFLVLDIDNENEESVEVLNDTMKALSSLATNENDKEAKEVLIDVLIGLLGRTESQIRGLVNLVWKELLKTIGKCIKNVIDAVINCEENLVIEEDDEKDNKNEEPKEKNKNEDLEEKEIDVFDLLENEDAQEEILIHKKMKEMEKKKKETKEQRQVQFQFRVCDLLETFCKAECNNKEFIEFIPLLIEGAGNLYNKSRFSLIYERLCKICEGISKHAPITKEITDEYMKEQFIIFSELLIKQKTSLIAQRALGFYIKYVEKGYALLAGEVKKYFISQIEREFNKKRCLPFKAVVVNMKRSELLQGTDVIKVCVIGAMKTSNMYLRIVALDFSYFLLKKANNKTNYGEIAEMLNKHIEEWMKVIVEHSEQKYALKIALVMNTLIRGIVDTGITFDSKYKDVSKYITDSLEQIPAKAGNLKKFLKDIRESIDGHTK
ncbi:hypothetical protein ENUP19_0282G0013 [Entamoeba nuttalli]|uniref:Uncharacterized protein n=2 Tax=Entamoeba nuttalli TaxID=412467 RepID=K2HTS6_ENTNP|nr:hypothetical protein ENU1_124660 [Entamoeba nuttalli P19]EKE39540.1 hypothetical protein ENU1_124660 [Entamoeba nuttalli P19]|eukprot:XP_008858127.1 hypothetical protein ENU1_124660 [Entamoeba nuttalli P19]